MQTPSFLATGWSRLRSAARATLDWLCDDTLAFGDALDLEAAKAKTNVAAAVAHVYGWIAQSPDFRDQAFTGGVAPDRLPARIDLRGFCPLPLPVQGSANACVGNAVALAVQFEQIKQKIAAGVSLPSRLFVYYFARLAELTQNVDAGCQIRDAIKAVVTRGVCPESLWPYDVAKVTYEPPAYAVAAASKETALRYGTVAQSADAIKGALAAGYPVVLGIAVYDSLETAAVSATGLVPMPQNGERLKGAHCILVLSYDDSTGLFGFANWWGAGWAVNGFGQIPYAYLANPNLCSDLWVIQALK